MQDIGFSNLADQVLLFIADTIESIDQEGLIDVDFHNDIINISTNYGIFVINKHSIAKQIWLASPISGPHHFSYFEDIDKWLTYNNIELFDILNTELQIHFKTSN